MPNDCEDIKANYETLNVYRNNYRKEAPIGVLNETTVKYGTYPEVTISATWKGICPYVCVSDQTDGLALHVPQITICGAWFTHLGTEQVDRRVEMRGKLRKEMI